MLIGALMDKTVVLSPFVLAELFSDPKLEPQDAADLRQLPLLAIIEGFWERAGRLRADVFRKNYRPTLADTMIAQCCIDHDVRLLTRDRDFRAFAKYGGLVLLA